MDHIKINPEWVLTEKDQKAVKRAITHTENLFGYKTINQIRDLLHKNQGKNSALIPVKKENGIYILVNTNAPGKHYKPDTSIIRELDRYSSHVEKIKTVVFDFKKTNCKPTDSITRVKHTINMERRQWSYIVFDGRNREKKYPSSYLEW